MQFDDVANNRERGPGVASVRHQLRTGGGMRTLRRILIVDDDAALRQSLAEQLERHGEFASRDCDSAAAALEIIRQERFDAVLLDIGLPDIDGRELCRLMRRAGVTAPIVMLTAADSEADTVQGPDA